MTRPPSPYLEPPAEKIAAVQQQAIAGSRTYTVGDVVSVARRFTGVRKLETQNAKVTAVGQCSACATVTVKYENGTTEKVATERIGETVGKVAGPVVKPRRCVNGPRVRAPQNSEQSRLNAEARRVARRGKIRPYSTPEQRAGAVTLRTYGLSHRQIGKFLGVGATTVGNWFREATAKQEQSNVQG